MDVTQNALGTRFGIEEIEAVTRAMQSGHTSGLTSDGEGANFAKEFAEYCGVEFALPLNGACNALSIAARLVDLQPGDEIISNPITYIATAIYPLKHGAKIRFAETSPDTLSVDEDTIEPLITDKTKALYIASYEGHVPDLDRIMDIAKRHNLIFVLDAARCAGGKYKGRNIAEIPHITAFSFQEQKSMTTCDGGMLTLGPEAPEDWHRKATQLRNVRGTGPIIGENCRMDEMRAAIGRVQLPKLDAMNDERRSLARRLTEGLSAFKGFYPVKNFPTAITSFTGTWSAWTPANSASPKTTSSTPWKQKAYKCLPTTSQSTSTNPSPFEGINPASVPFLKNSGENKTSASPSIWI